MKLVTSLLAFVAAAISGCVYEAPLTTDHTIAIDPALLGVWEVVPEEGAAADITAPLVVVPFSETEYLIHEQSGKDGRFFRGYLMVLGGVPCLQLQDIGSGAGPRPAAVPACYTVVSYVIDGDELEFRLLNDDHVPTKLTTSAELQRAFLAHKDKPDLFVEPMRCRRVLLPPLDLPPAAAGKRTEANRDRLVTAAFSPSGQYLLAGLQSGHLAAIDLHHAKLHWAVAAHQQPVKHIAFGGKDRWALTAADDLKAHLWNVTTGRLNDSFEAAPLKRVYDIALSSDARYAATRGFDGFGVVWDLLLNRKERDITSYGFALGGTRPTLVSTLGRDPHTELLHLAEVNGGEPRKILAGKLIGSVAIDPAGAMVAACGSSSQAAMVWLVRARDGEGVGEITVPQAVGATAPPAALCAAFSANGKFLAIGLSDGRVVRADIARRTIVDVWKVGDGRGPQEVGFVGATDDSLHALTMDDEFRATTMLFTVGQPLPVWTLPGTVTIDGQRMLGAMVAHDGDLVFFNVADGRLLRRFRPYEQGRAWHDLDGSR